MARDGGGRRHDRTHQMGPAALALPSLEIAIRRAGAALAGPQDIGIHPETHTASGLAPLEARLRKDTIESELFRLGLDLLRSGYHQRAHGGRDLSSFDDFRRSR